MANIKINFDGLDQNASALNTKLANYNDLLNRMTQMRQRIKSTWEGKSAESWDNIMEQYIAKSNKYIDVINGFLDYTKNVSSNFSQLDSECANIINNSF